MHPHLSFVQHLLLQIMEQWVSYMYRKALRCMKVPKVSFPVNWHPSPELITFTSYCIHDTSFYLAAPFDSNSKFEPYTCSYETLDYAGESSIPCNVCGTPCILRTANTENNRGRKFYSCQSQECNFFVYVYLSLVIVEHFILNFSPHLNRTRNNFHCLDILFSQNGYFQD